MATLSAAPDSVQRHALDDQCWVEHRAPFLDAALADAYFQHFTRPDFPWQRQPIRNILIRRANVWYADDARCVYRYSGQVWTPQPFTALLNELRSALRSISSANLNSVLATFYPDGQTGVAWHDDNDFPQQPDTPIVSLSLGAGRTFKIRRKADQQVLASYELTHGSVIVMGGALQRHYDHAITKTTRPVGPRVNLSFRTFYPTSA
jgi:alkylated DNA repair dioxygenase AlkB